MDGFQQPLGTAGDGAEGFWAGWAPAGAKGKCLGVSGQLEVCGEAKASPARHFVAG